MYISSVNSSPTFSGKFDLNTLKLAADTMGKEGYKAAKKFRAGKNRFDEFGIVYETLPVKTSCGKNVLQTDTYMKISNKHSKKTPFLIKLADGKMSFGQEMLDLISAKMAKLDKLKK